jgi:hypothetical protein
MTIGCLHVATTTIAATIDVVVVMTVAVTIGDMMSNSRKAATTSATYLLRW